MTDKKNRKKEKVTLSSVKKHKTKSDGSEYICTSVSNAWNFQSEKCKMERVSSQINRFFRNYLIYIWNTVLVISLDDELGDQTYVDVLIVSSELSPPKFTLIGNDDFLKNLAWISWCFWVFADISARSSRKKKTRIIHTRFFLVVQFCVRVSASNFQVLIRKSGGARASGNFIPFFGWPARMPIEPCIAVTYRDIFAIRGTHA